MKTFISHIKESVIDVRRNTLSPHVFDKDQLKPDVRSYLLEGLNSYKAIAPIIKLHLIGSILTHRYADNADLDINILFDVPDHQKDEVLDKLNLHNKENNGKLLPGTQHPVNYYMVVDSDKFDMADSLADGVFDILTNKFIRKPEEFSFDLSEYMDEFHRRVKKIDIAKDELNRDIIDYEYLKSLDENSVRGIHLMVVEKLREIQKDCEYMVDLYIHVHEDRIKIFSNKLTPRQIVKFGSKNRMPSNVIYKLLERYHYLALFTKIKELLKDGDLDDKDVEELANFIRKN